MHRLMTWFRIQRMYTYIWETSKYTKGSQQLEKKLAFTLEKGNDWQGNFLPRESPHGCRARFFVVPLTQGVPLLWTAKIENPTQSLCRTAKVKILHGWYILCNIFFYEIYFSKHLTSHSMLVFTFMGEMVDHFQSIFQIFFYLQWYPFCRIYMLASPSTPWLSNVHPLFEKATLLRNHFYCNRKCWLCLLLQPWGCGSSHVARIAKVNL